MNSINSNNISELRLVRVFKSHVCKLVFLGALAAGYFLVPIARYFGEYRLLVSLFLALFAVSITCLVRTIKDRVLTGVRAGSSVIAILGGIVGLSALQFCSVNAVMCGSTAGFGILSLILPGFALHYLHHHAIAFLTASVVIQSAGLISMGCFQKKD